MVETTILVPRPTAQSATEPTFGEPCAVEGRGVEVADPELPGTIDHGARRLVLDRLVQAADRRGPEGETPELDHPPRSSGTSSAGSRCWRSQFSFVAMCSSAEARARSACPAAIAS